MVRFAPSMHGDGDHGFVPMLINVAREKRVSAYIGQGSHRWAAVPQFDAATLFRLALDKGGAGATYHGAAEESIALRDIAEAIGRGLNLPVVSVSSAKAADNFGWFTRFAGLDCPASSASSQAQLGWQPSRAGLLSDLDQGRYFES